MRTSWIARKGQSFEVTRIQEGSIRDKQSSSLGIDLGCFCSLVLFVHSVTNENFAGKITGEYCWFKDIGDFLEAVQNQL